MQRVCFTLRIRPEHVAAYRAAHADVWPAMRDALTRHGWHNYSLFVTDDGQLIGYVETPDFEKAVAGMQSEPVNARWQAVMKPFFDGLPTAAADTSMTPLPMVFHLP